MSEPVLVQVEDAIASIRFNRPEVLNALNLDLARGFLAAVDQVIADQTAKVVVISGEGRAFMAGGDLGYFKALPKAARPAASRVLIEPLNEAMLKLAQCRLPVIASINGAAAGGGMSFALMADLAIAADDASFNLSYIKVAQNPDCGGSWALARLVGLRKALEIALLSDTIDAPEALRLGLVNKVVPAADLRSASLEMARRLARGPALAVAATKALLRGAAMTSLEDQLEAECSGFARLAGSDDFDEALDAFFGKRKPSFAGR